MLQASRQQLECQVIPMCQCHSEPEKFGRLLPSHGGTFVDPGGPEHPPGHDQQVGRGGEGHEGGAAAKVIKSSG